MTVRSHHHPKNFLGLGLLSPLLLLLLLSTTLIAVVAHQQDRQQSSSRDDYFANLVPPHKIQWGQRPVQGSTFETAGESSSLSSSFQSTPVKQRSLDEDNNDDDSIDNLSHEITHSYGGGLVPEENEDEIDCSLFEHLDELPAFCLGDDESSEAEELWPLDPSASPGQDSQNGTSGGEGENATDSLGTTIYGPGSDSDDESQNATDTTVGVDQHSINIPLSIAIYNLEKLTDRRKRMFIGITVKVMSIMVDRYTPFDVIAPEGGNHERRQERLLDGEEYGGGDGGDNSGTGGAGGNQDDQPDLLARLYFSSVAVSDAPNVENWWQLRVKYVAFWPNGEPVVNRPHLQQIETACRQVINMTVDAKRFWEELLEEGNDSEDDNFILMPPGEEDESSIQDLVAIAAVAKSGEEYPLDFEQYQGNMDDSEGNGMKTSSSSNGRDYSQPLTLEWQVREWFGLALCIFTLSTATLLWAVSSYLHRRQMAKHMWGLTEQGVGDLLQVGWAYHQQPGQNGNQLFLQVYHKGRMGYSDDNSILQGSIVMQQPIPEGNREVSGSSTTATPTSH